MRRFIFVFIALGSAFGSLFADWTYYTPPASIASITVSDIIKDSQGRVWFATGHKKSDDISFSGAGVCVYDGNLWTTYTTAHGLPSNDVNALVIDSTGRLWAATEGGVAYFSGGTWVLANNTASVRDVSVDTNGTTLWFATYLNGVLRYNGSWTNYTTSNSGLTTNSLSSVAVASSGRKFFGALNGRIFELNGSSWTAHAPSSSPVWTVFADSAGNVWAGTDTQGVYRKSSGGTSFSEQYTTSHGLAYNSIFGMQEDADGAIWFMYGVRAGSNSAVITKLLGGVFTTYSTGDGYPSSNLNCALFDDQHGNEAIRQYWFGTVTNGVARYGYPETVSGWPITLPGGSTNSIKHSSPALADINGDGRKEIIVGSLDGYLYVVDSNGALLWRAKSSVGSSIDSSPAIGDIDNDGHPEIVVGFGTETDGQFKNGGIVVFSHTGSIKWEKASYDATGDGIREGVFSTPAIADIDGDGAKDIVVGGWDQEIYALQWNGTPVARIDNDGDGRIDEDGLGDMSPAPHSGDGCPGRCGVDDDGDGQVDEGNPMDDDEDGLNDEDHPEWPRNNQDSVWSSPAIGDMQGDGDLEIAIGGDSSPGGEFGPGGTLRLLNSDGSRESAGWHKGLEQVIWSSPALADLDGDGKLEVIVGNGHFYGGVPSKIYAFRVDGTGYLQPNGTFASLPEYAFASPAIGDLNNDGWPEVVAAAHNGMVYAWDRNGNLLPGWPVEPHRTWIPGADILGSPVIGDVDGDGGQDVLIAISGTLYAIRSNGSVIPGYSFAEVTSVWYTIANSPAIGDIDNDGQTDIILATTYSNDGGATRAGSRIFRWRSGPVTSSDWPMFRKDAVRNACYRPVAKKTAGGAFGLVASSDVPVIVEKAEYKDAQVHGETVNNNFGSNSVGSTVTSQQWYFPDANTQRYRVVLCLVNPSETIAASTTITYLDNGSSVWVDNFALNPLTRRTIVVNDQPGLSSRDLAVSISSSAPIVAEKSMSWSGTMQGVPVDPMGGASSLGAPRALTQWYLAEGSTAGWKLWYIIFNPSTSQSSQIVLDYMLEGSPPIQESFQLGPGRKRTIYVNDLLPFANVSLRALGTVPIVVERIMHWNADVGGERIYDIGGHDSMGIEAPQRLWYLAEGSTAGWKLWVLLMNPNSSPVDATVTWLREGASPIVQVYTLAPNSRKTIEVRLIPGLEFANISVKVETTTLPIIVERAMYWDDAMSFGMIYNADGHNSPGVNSLATNWYMASGSTEGWRTYVLFMNTSTQIANVVLKLLKEDGTQIVRRFAVAPNSRRSIQLNYIWGNGM